MHACTIALTLTVMWKYCTVRAYPPDNDDNDNLKISLIFIACITFSNAH